MSVIDGRQPIVFCDFDGTITLSDNIVALMRHFNPPGWETIVERIVAGDTTLQQGVGDMFALLPSAAADDIRRYVLDTAGIRGGFAELLQLCRDNGIRFIVASGGIDFFVHPLLEPFAVPASDIYCNSADFSGERITIVWPHPCDAECDNGGCGMCKTKIIRDYPSDRYFRIMIGDSLTDFAGARLADLVFARSHLLSRCRELELPHVPYETFYDVVRKLETLMDQKEG